MVHIRNTGKPDSHGHLSGVGLEADLPAGGAVCEIIHGRPHHNLGLQWKPTINTIGLQPSESGNVKVSFERGIPVHAIPRELLDPHIFI